MLGAEYYHVSHQYERMEEKPARLTVLIDADKKKAFEALCASQDITASQVVRQLIRDYLAKHGIQYAPQLRNNRD
jgi:alpha-galactosidase/6-phospho-beta-glucosidase family protein